MGRKHFVHFTENESEKNMSLKEYSRRYGMRHNPMLTDTQTTHQLRDRLIHENWIVREEFSEVHLTQ